MKPPKYVCLAALAVLFVLAVFSPVTQAQTTTPNVVLILTDDQGWGDVGIHGNEDLQTPNMDLLATEGALFQHFYVAPVCSPTRAELLTGRYHPRGGVSSTSAGGERLRLDERTVAESFKAAGYNTAIFGKWHNGQQYPYHPLARGFDEFYGFPSGHWGHYFDWILEHNNKLVQGEGYIVDDLTNHTLRFIEKHHDQPFFVYLPYNTPHSPMQVPDRFYERFRERELKMPPQNAEQDDIVHTRAALAMVENIDWNVGRILSTLHDLDIEDNTIIIFVGDNGPNGWRWNGGLRGRKGSTDEGGVRVPFFIRWPDRIDPGLHITEIAGAIDLLPTLTDLAGISTGADKPLDGISLKPLLLNTAEPDTVEEWPDRKIFSHWNDQVSVRTQQYRLDHMGRLYDVSIDFGQQTDIASEYPEVALELSAAVEKWRDEVLSEMGEEDLPFPVGYREFPITHLPARDGVAHGNVERSNQFPNDSYFTAWTSTEDKITWKVDVKTAGNYEAVVYYTVPEDHIGSSVALSVGDVQVNKVITSPHDPPLVGAAHDRVPRQESYVKEFRPLNMGMIQLPEGQGELKLKALDIPAADVMDVWRITLTLLDE